MAATDYDVIQIGYGPVSKISALMLERQGWRVGIFERFSEVYPKPRAVCVDHELYRVLHAVGLGEITRETTEPGPVYRWFNSEWKELLALDWTATSISGGTEVNFIHQPTFEARLHDEVLSRKGIDLHLGAEAVGLGQDDDRATVTVRDVKTGEERKVTAAYLLGIDGANSFVRETLGVGWHDKGFEADWLVVDFALEHGLTARDLGLIECGQYCDPHRPTTIVPGGTDARGRVCRRWEFMRLPHETVEEMLDEAKVWELLGAWIKPDQGELQRHTVYTFRSLIAEEWRRGRILLAGDAAHLMPPFMGQGMCSGLRDVWNLNWKLDRVLRGTADPTILDTYGPERRPHVSDIVDMSVFLGSIICIPDENKAAERDEMFLSGKAPPPADFPILTDGILARGADGAPAAPAGQLSPGGMTRYGGRTDRFDAFVSPGFTLIVNRDVDPAALSPGARKVLSLLGVQIVTVADRADAHDQEIADTQAQILPYMAEQGVSALLIRPDFYVFGGAADATTLEALIGELGRQATVFGLMEANGAPAQASA